MKRIRFLSPAEIEMLDAAFYYESRVPELGTDFISTIETAVRDLSDDLKKWPLIRKEIRRRILPVSHTASYIKLIQMKSSLLQSCTINDVRIIG